jgi:hypothetical protein
MALHHSLSLARVYKESGGAMSNNRQQAARAEKKYAGIYGWSD